MHFAHRAIFVAAVVVCSGCAAGYHHTGDSSLIEIFARNESKFEALLRDVEGETKLQTIQPKTLIYGGVLLNLESATDADIVRVGMAPRRLSEFQQRMRDLGLTGGIRKTEQEVEFRADQGSLFNGDSYKGYMYRNWPPAHLRADLDGYKASASDRNDAGDLVVYRRLKNNWYLYLFVNR